MYVQKFINYCSYLCLTAADTVEFFAKVEDFDWARSNNSYFDKFTEDTRYQIINIILIYILIVLSISLIRDIHLVAIILSEFPECAQTRKSVHMTCARYKTI